MYLFSQGWSHDPSCQWRICLSLLQLIKCMMLESIAVFMVTTSTLCVFKWIRMHMCKKIIQNCNTLHIRPKAWPGYIGIVNGNVRRTLSLKKRRAEREISSKSNRLKRSNLRKTFVPMYLFFGDLWLLCESSSFFFSFLLMSRGYLSSGNVLLSGTRVIQVWCTVRCVRVSDSK